jgi:hypothetical protein
MRRSVFALLGAAVLIAMHVRAEGDPLELEWNAPKGCPTHDDVIGEVRRIVGTGEVRRRVRAIANVSNIASSGGERWSLQLKTEEGGSGGERTLDGHSCKAVASAAALVLALTLQTDPAPPPSVTSASAPPSASVPPPPTSAPVPPPPSPKLRVAPLLRAGGGIALSGLPSAAGVAAAELGARYGRFEADITFAYLSETSQTDPADKEGLSGGQFAQVALGAIGCVAPVVGPEKPGIEVWGCAGAEVEWMLARRYGPISPMTSGIPTEATNAYFAPVISPRLTWAPFRRVAFVLESTFSFPLERPRFVLCQLPIGPDGQCPTGAEQPIFRAPPAGVRALLAVELRF